MEMLSKFTPQVTACFAALALSVVTISATVAPVDLAAPPVASQGMMA